MRKLTEHFFERELSLIDGVKVLFEDGYVSAIPDQEKALFHLYAEAESLAKASELLSNLKNLMESWKENP